MGNLDLILAAPFFMAAEPTPTPSGIQLTVTLDRTFAGDTPAAGPNIGSIPSFQYNSMTWEMYQAIPFLGINVSPFQRGDARIQLRPSGIDADSMTMDDYPATITMSTDANWLNKPWTFTRGTDANQFNNNIGRGGAHHRTAMDYERVIENRNVQTAALLGVAQGQSFTVELTF